MLLIDDCLIIGAALLIAGSIFLIIRGVNTFKIICWDVVFSYGVIVAGITLFPIPYQLAEMLDSVPDNFIPFFWLADVFKGNISSSLLIQVLGNVIMAVPYGMIIGSVFKKMVRLKAIMLSVLFPFCIEMIQKLVGIIIGVNYRSFDIDDIILGTIGAIIGILIARTFFAGLKDLISEKCRRY